MAFLIFHFLLGIVGYFVPGISTLAGISVFLYAASQIARTANRNGWAHLGAAYIASMEVWVRMTKAALPWEFGKIAAAALLLLGLVFERNLLRKPVFYLLILLLLPAALMVEGVDFEQFRQFLTFQLGGLFLLAISAMYFFHRRFRVEQFRQLMLFIVGPVLTMVVQITLKSPSVSQLKFELGANFAASGGYGPNQVSTILGLGMACLALNWMFRLKPLFNRWVDAGLFALFSLRILLTFSRGGVATAILALGIAYFVFLRDRGYSFKKLLQPLSIGVLAAGIFIAVNGISGGALSDRFRGETWATQHGYGEVTLSSASSGRFDILLTDIQMWLDNPLFGVGVGVSNLIRPEYGVNNISHMEQSRLLAEHGFLGILVLVIIIGVAWLDFLRRRGLQKSILVLFFLMAFLTMAHSATRLAMAGFVYGLGFIILTHTLEKSPVYRQPPLAQREQPLGSGEHSPPLAAGH